MLQVQETWQYRTCTFISLSCKGLAPGFLMRYPPLLHSPPLHLFSLHVLHLLSLSPFQHLTPNKATLRTPKMNPLGECLSRIILRRTENTSSLSLNTISIHPNNILISALYDYHLETLRSKAIYRKS